MKNVNCYIFILNAYILNISPAFAGLLASNSRVIFDDNTINKSLMLSNTNNYPVIAQFWVDDGITGPDYNSPYAITPSVLKFAPQEIRSLRIIFNGENLAQDRESMHWINLYEIPSIKKDLLENNHINLAMNTQIKVFYRPQNLQEQSLEQLQNKIKYKLMMQDGLYVLQLTNPTGYYLNITGMRMVNQSFNSKIKHQHENSLAPFSTKNYIFENAKFKADIQNTLEYNLIQDDGYPVPFKINIAFHQ